MISSQAQPELPEATLIQLILDGNAEAFCELVRPHQHVLYLKALSIVHSEADAEEVVQNAVLKAFKKLCQFRHDSQFRTWLMSITINESRMWLRVFCLTCYLLLCGTLLAQTSASISGTVTDLSGAAVAGARCDRNRHLGTGAVRSGTSNATGFYTIPSLAPGDYLVNVRKEGFRTTEFKRLPLSVAQALVLNVRLPLGTVQESVEVSDDSVAPIDTETSQLSTLVSAKTITDLPLAAQILAAGETPFLHVKSENGAKVVYQKIGFRLRTAICLTVISLR